MFKSLVFFVLVNNTGVQLMCAKVLQSILDDIMSICMARKRVKRNQLKSAEDATQAG